MAISLAFFKIAQDARTEETMRACIQRVSRAKVIVIAEPRQGAASRAEVAGEIDAGMLVLLGVAARDEEADARWLADKIAGLRIFEDEAGKMNLSLTEMGGAMLVVSQFTLLGDCRKGRRPSFGQAAPPELAEALYETFVAAVRAQGVSVATGRFRRQMQVELVNDGPVTLVVDSAGSETRGAEHGTRS